MKVVAMLWFAIVLGALNAQAAWVRPNILLIVSDDQGYPDLGCMGLKPVETPNLDRLAAEGVRCTSFYVSCPACTPSRATILTGRYPQRNGLYDLVRNDMVNYGHRYTATEYAISPEMTLGLDPREVTLGDVLRKAGYRTGVVGKWDMGQARRYLPLQRGFDFFYGFGNNGVDYYTHERYGVPSMFRGNERTQADRGVYATDLFQREALRFLDMDDDRPWFLYLAFNAPHSGSSYAVDAPAEAERETKPSVAPRTRPAGVGVQAPEAFVVRYRDAVKQDKLARYYAAITCMDTAIGQVLASVKAKGQADRTLVIFLSDNGGGSNGGNTPLRGGKANMFEGGLRVPFIACWPGRLPAGIVCDEFLTTLEIFPTVAKAAGANPDPVIKLDGFDMLPVLRGEKTSPRKEMFWRWRDERAARVGHWKWVDGTKGAGLFDLARDAGERHDLSDQKPEIVNDLKTRFEQWVREMQRSEPRGPFRDY